MRYLEQKCLNNSYISGTISPVMSRSTSQNVIFLRSPRLRSHETKPCEFFYMLETVILRFKLIYVVLDSENILEQANFGIPRPISRVIIRNVINNPETMSNEKKMQDNILL